MDQYDKVVQVLQTGDYWVDIHAGVVWSKKKEGWRLIGNGRTKGGYRVVRLYYNGEVLNLLTHRLVWMVAYGCIPEDFQVGYKDGNNQNNSIANLQLLSPTEIAQSKSYGGTRKLTPRLVAEMREVYSAGGISMQGMADMFGVSVSTAHAAIRGRTWSNVY